MSDNEADCGKICGISCNSPVVTRNPQRGMHFQGINPLSLITYLGTLSSSMVNTLTFRLICSLLEQYESDTTSGKCRSRLSRLSQLCKADKADKAGKAAKRFNGFPGHRTSALRAIWWLCEADKAISIRRSFRGKLSLALPLPLLTNFHIGK